MSSPEHTPIGNPCSVCTLPNYRHRKRAKRIRVRTSYHKRYDKKRANRNRDDRPQRQDRIVFIDGEGQGRDFHIYNYLAAVDENDMEWSVGKEKKVGLKTRECLDFLLSLPQRSVVFGYALGYDQTKWLYQLPNKSLFDLFHEDRRAFTRDNRILYHPIRWRGYRLNYCNRRLSISRGTRTVAIWDIFAFFQARFTKAISDWRIAPLEVVEQIQRMKEQRSQFDKLDFSKVAEYCKQECKYGAKLGRALINAHKAAGLPLKVFYGAGSTASVFLKQIGVARKRGIHPKEMEHAIACAFFGGRFENSFAGLIDEKVFNADISSAYPYAATFLPCLQHGKWGLVRKPTDRQISGATLALCHWSIPKVKTEVAWGTLPIRLPTGTIIFPSSAKGGWCWKNEFQAASRIRPTVCIEAWLYHTDCDCAPFASIPQYYLERLKIGKEGPGIVIKLGLNSIYGKLAQSKGVNPPYQSWIWAGNITSDTRAQLLGAIEVVKNPWDILTLATDGICSRVKLDLPKPRDTKTDIVVKCNDGKTTRKPLGGWEQKDLDHGLFCVRPGINFPPNPTEDEIEIIRARGLGRKTVYDKWAEIAKAWNQGKRGLSIGGRDKKGEPYLSRFIGAKSAISESGRGYKRSPRYGEWIPHKITIGFGPKPKREKTLADGRLKVWRHFPFDSVPYKHAMRDPIGIAMAEATDRLLEQPEGADYAEYGE